MSEAVESEIKVETDERPDGGSTPKRRRKDPNLPKDAAESRLTVQDAAESPLAVPLAELPALPKTATQGYCLGCGDTSCDRFRSAPMGFKVAIVLLLGEKFENFIGQADICRTCERACGQPLIEACEALVVSVPPSTSAEPLKLPAKQQSRLRKWLHTLRADYKERDTAPLFEKLLAMNAETPSRFGGDQLVLLPVPTGYTVHLSDRYFSE
jgi:hypothetical protein